MKRKSLFIILVLSISCFLSPRAFSIENLKKTVIFFADWGNNPVPKDIINILSSRPSLKLALALPKNSKDVDALKPLVGSGRIEAALTLPDEPILPLIYEMNISSPVSIKFSWKQDIWDMIANSGQKYYQDYSLASHGLYLRSGLFSDELIPNLHEMGVRWVNMDKVDGFEGPVYLKNDVLVFINNKDIFKNADECMKYIYSSTSVITCVFFDKENPLTGQFLSDFARVLKNKRPWEDEILMVTPWQVYTDLKSMTIDAGSLSIRSDIKPWLQRPSIWYYISEARKVLEDYRNSGSAKMDTLDKIKSELFGLYRYELIDTLQQNTNAEDDRVFQAGLSNIYKLANTTMPVWMSESVDYLPVLSGASRFSINSGKDSLEINNSEAYRRNVHIKALNVSLDKENVRYSVVLDSSLKNVPYRVEIYIDMNNEYRIGSTDMLSETNAFMDPVDAWELAIRIESGYASLFRSGRDKPKLIKKVFVESLDDIIIPRSLLRGNPLIWGYQALVLLKSKGSESWIISDFLSPDDKTRQKLFKKSVLSLPALRYIEK